MAYSLSELQGSPPHRPIIETTHFRIFYGRRGVGRGPYRGTSDSAKILATRLDRIWQAVNKRFGRIASGPPVSVWLLEPPWLFKLFPGPFSDRDTLERVDYMVIPANLASDIPDHVFAHELSHIANCRLRTTVPAAWNWLDEARAILAEIEFREFTTRITPRVSIDSIGDTSGAVRFVQYLALTRGNDFIERWWIQQVACPFAALGTLSVTRVQDLIEDFFLWAFRSELLQVSEMRGDLDHAAYCAFSIPETIRRLTISPSSPEDKLRVKAAERCKQNGLHQYEWALTSLSKNVLEISRDTETLLLVINVGYRGRRYLVHNDGAQFIALFEES